MERPSWASHPFGDGRDYDYDRFSDPTETWLDRRQRPTSSFRTIFKDDHVTIEKETKARYIISSRESKATTPNKQRAIQIAIAMTDNPASLLKLSALLKPKKEQSDGNKHATTPLKISR